MNQQRKTSFKTSHYISLMGDESTDISSKEELSVCARWLADNKPVEDFLGIIHVKESTKEIKSDLCNFLQSKSNKMHEVGFDGVNTMAGHRTGHLRLQ